MQDAPQGEPATEAAETAAESAPPEEQLTPLEFALAALEQIGRAIDTLALRLPAAQVAAQRRGCGTCAERTPIVYGAEAHFAAAHIAGSLSPADRALARRRTEEWLRRAMPAVRSARELPAERCPYLMPDGRCLIDPGRPLVCRMNELPPALTTELEPRVWNGLQDVMRLCAAALPALHHYLWLPAGVFAALAGRDRRNVRKDIRRLKLDARRFTAWPAPAVEPSAGRRPPAAEDEIVPAIDSTAPTEGES